MKLESRRQLKAMLRKNWLLKIRHPYITFTEIFLPTAVMVMLMAVRTQVDTRMHTAQPYIRKDMLVEVGKDKTSPPFNQILEQLVTDNEYLAFAPDSEETSMMINIMSLYFPLLKSVARVYKDEMELEAYIRSDLYSTCDHLRNCSNLKIRGAVVFHNQGPDSYDYSIRLNHTWAFSGFPDVKKIMDVNGPYLDDLELGVNTIPIMQYGFSGFLTLQQVFDSFIIVAGQQTGTSTNVGDEVTSSSSLSQLRLPSKEFIPSNIRVVPFPTRAYTDDEFQFIVKKVMGVLYLLGFLYPISRLISYSVFEKEHKIKEGLYMMGLKSEILHISWFITYALQFAVSSAIITIFTMGSLFKYSDKSLVFTYFFSFGMSAITLSFMISTFFMRAKTAVAVGTLSLFGAFFPYYTVNDPDISLALKAIASLLSPTAFALGSINFADYERAHVGLRWSNIWRESSGVNFMVCLSMMIFDTVLYGAIGVSLDKVFPKEDHTRFSWAFMLPKCLRRKKDAINPCVLNSGMKVEAISLEMKQQEAESRCLQIRNLSKVYSTKKGECCAVNSLQLSLYENQIFALLGHNGAGKSTTISMLVGLIPPTSGDALVFGRNILTDMDDVRKDLGVCPQNDILFPELTVKEHLEMYGILKGVKECVVESVVAEMIDEVGLADKVNTVVSSLSGGMKSKLSLGIALIGDSKVIILDEPTSGMDPYSVRLTWQLIKKVKKGRIVLLTTHSMDEAEFLGDRIAIMANGTLKCCGSSLYLKHQYGVGYTLTLVKTAAGASLAADIVHRHIPSATIVSEVGTEISFKLPLVSSSCFEGMFQEIESSMKKSASCSENECAGIESYGISITTLEEVFLRVAEPEFDGRECVEQETTLIDPVISQTSQYHVPKKHSFSKLCGYLKGFIIVLCVIVARTCNAYGAIVMDNQNEDGSLSYTVLHNSSCQHAAPTYINLMNSAILKLSALDRNMSIKTRNHPLPLTKSQHQQRHDLDAFSAAIIVTIAFSFIPASFAVPIVKEREVKAKHKQLLSGVSILSYWVSTYLWDFVSFLLPSSFAIALFYIFGLDQFVGVGYFCATIMLFLVFGLAVASSTYCLTFFFTDHSLAQNVILLVHFFTGLILMVISFIMDILETTTDVNSYLKNIFRLSPGFCFADGLASLALLRQGMKDKSSHGVFDWNVTGASICYLAVESIFYFLLTLGLEVLPPHKLFLHIIDCCWAKVKNLCFGNASDIVKPLLNISPDAVSVDLDEDVDVAAERNRVLSGAADKAILYLRNLRKVYPGEGQSPKVAVQSLTFAVREGECFGFLGTNGARETTTLSMLSGEECPSEGTAFIFGKDILSDTKAARPHIGYCPQFDALLEYLTVKEHLELYAKIKRVPDIRVEEVVMQKIIEFDLLKHANKPSFSLSGGNKRKLSVAIAMIGDPPIVILDEPSTGMDPLAKRFMWDVISHLSTRRGRTAVILTTHSMNEAQALCTRMGIMVGGRLQCIGSPQHLKTRFGNHLELEVKPTEVNPAHLETLSLMIQEKLCQVPSHPRGLLSDLEICIGASDITFDSASVSEISLSRDSIIMIARWLGDEERVMTLINSKASSGGSLSEQLFDQVVRDGGIPLPVFTEWWLTKQKLADIESFILSSFPGATFQGCNGLSVRYQLPFEEELSLADAFGHIERNKTQFGIAEYSISQSTLESIFNRFAANS